MFLLTKPDKPRIAQFLAAQAEAPFSYSEVGATRAGTAPSGYQIDHNRVQLGTGRAAFARARQALREWQMFALGWTELHPASTPLATGATVAALVSHLGFWSLNASRIVYVFDEQGDTIEKYGFAYGTLTAHGERGEERFSVEYHRANETVWYDLYAFSQPQHIMARLGYPFSRYLQKQFARDSQQAMVQAMQDPKLVFSQV